MNAECAEAYLGQFLAGEQVSSLSAYAQKRLKESKYDRKERLFAIEDTEKDVQDAIARYCNLEKIRQFFEFDAGFDSMYSSAKEAGQKEKERLNNSKLLVRALQFANKKLKQEIEEMRSTLYSELDARVEAERHRDEESVARIKSEYAEHLRIAEARAEELVSKELETDYQKACELQRKANYDTAFSLAAGLFRSLQGYKDSDARAMECAKQAEEYSKKITRLIITIICTILILAGVIAMIVRNKNADNSPSASPEPTPNQVALLHIDDFDVSSMTGIKLP